MIRRRRNTGFTIIELMLSMAFVGVLLVTIAMTSMHIMGIYTKGLTVREINQSGRTISEDIQRTIAASVPFKVDPAKTGAASELGDSNYADSRYVDHPEGGRLCTGRYTYAWNYGKELSGESASPVYNTFSDSEDEIRFVKVNDLGGILCTDMTRDIERAQAKDLLVAGDRNLAVQKLTVSSHSQDDASGQQLYAINLMLGTNDQSQLNISDGSCRPPNEGDGFEEFCAINQFSIIARAGNRSGSL